MLFWHDVHRKRLNVGDISDGKRQPQMSWCMYVSSSFRRACSQLARLHLRRSLRLLAGQSWNCIQRTHNKKPLRRVRKLGLLCSPRPVAPRASGVPLRKGLLRSSLPGRRCWTPLIHRNTPIIFRGTFRTSKRSPMANVQCAFRSPP